MLTLKYSSPEKLVPHPALLCERMFQRYSLPSLNRPAGKLYDVPPSSPTTTSESKISEYVPLGCFSLMYSP